MQPAFEEQIAYRRDGHNGTDPDIDVLAEPTVPSLPAPALQQSGCKYYNDSLSYCAKTRNL